MPINRDKRLLFIHIPKNAGKSIDSYFGLTPHSASASKSKYRYRWRSPLNALAKLILNMTADRNSRKYLYGVIDLGLTAQHLTYQEIQLLRLIPPEELNSYFSLAVVRNPWDRATSIYRHMRTDKKAPVSTESFLSFVQAFFGAPHRRHNDLSFRRQQHEFIRNCDGRIAVTNIIRFENLAEELKYVAARFHTSSDIPWVGKQHSNVHYRDLYTEESRDLVARLFARDIEMFNYEF